MKPLAEALGSDTSARGFAPRTSRRLCTNFFPRTLIPTRGWRSMIVRDRTYGFAHCPRPADVRESGSRLSLRLLVRNVRESTLTTSFEAALWSGNLGRSDPCRADRHHRSRRDNGPCSNRASQVTRRPHPSLAEDRDHSRSEMIAQPVGATGQDCPQPDAEPPGSATSPVDPRRYSITSTITRLVGSTISTSSPISAYW